MKYGITDVAAVLGVTTSALRYFEKEHLIKVERDEGGRRFYDEEDAFRLLSYMKYRSMDFSMKDIVYQFSGEENDWKKIHAREVAAKKQALERSAYYKELADSIDDHIRAIELIGKLEGSFEFAKSPAVLFAQDAKDGWLSLDCTAQASLKHWVSQMPRVKLGVVYQESSSSAFGFFVNKSHTVSETLPVLGLHTTQIPAFSALHTVTKAKENFAFQPRQSFAEGLAYAKKRGLEIGEPSWGRILLVEVERGQRLHPYVEMWIPVS